MQRELHLVDRRRGLGAEQLDERVLRRAAAGARDAGLAVVQHRVEHALQGAERRGRDAAHEDQAERQPVEARGVHRLARALQQEIVEHALRAIGRHEHVVEDDVPAAGALQAGDLPGVDRSGSPAAAPGRCARRGGPPSVGCDHAAEQRPVAMTAAARIAPVAAETKAALGHGGLAGRHQRRADQRRGVAAPHLLRGAIVQQRHEPGMHAGARRRSRRSTCRLRRAPARCRRRRRAPSRSRPSAWAAARGRTRPAASRRWSRPGSDAVAVASGERSASVGIIARARAMSSAGSGASVATV